MLKFIAGEGLPPKSATRLKYAVVVFAASCFGYLSGKVQWNKKKELFLHDKLTEYECQDKINTLIEKKKVPAVIYYYQPSFKHHYILRAHMLKYSNLYPNNAIWVMANLTQDLQQAKEALRSVIFPDSSIRLQVRFPKENLAVFESNSKGELQLIKQGIGNRRQVYNYNVFEQQFQSFLQQNKVINGQDPVESTLKVTQSALFKNQL